MKLLKKIKLLIFCLIISITLLFSINVVLAQEMVWKFAHVDPKEISTIAYQGLDPYQVAAEKFKEIIEKETEGKIKVEIYPSGQLGEERELIESLKIGVLDLAITASAPLSAWESSSMVFDLPFLFKDIKTARRILDGEIGKEIMNNLEKHGIKGLSLSDNSFRNIVTVKKQIKTTEDLKGLKFRIMKSPIYIAMFQAFGASAVPIPFTEVYTSLQTGVVDGYEIPLFPCLSYRTYEVAKYISLTQHILTVTPIMMSMNTWNKLTPDVQKIVIKAANAARDAKNELVDAIDKIAITSLEEEGMIFTEVNHADFASKMDIVYEKFEDEIGKDLIDRITHFE